MKKQISRHMVIVAVLALVAITVLSVLAFRVKDIRKDVLRAEKSVLAVLRSHGVTEKDITSRVEEEWNRARTLGKKVTYVFKPKKNIGTASLKEKIKEKLADIKGMRLGRTSYSLEETGERTTVFAVTRGRETVLLVTMKSATPKKAKPVVVEKAKAAPVPVVRDYPVVALVLDDFGYTKKNLENLKAVGVPVTMAVLPNTPYAGEACSFAKDNGMEVILHMPMEPAKQTTGLEKDTVMISMDRGTVENIVDRAFDSVPGATGASNHMGSGATANEGLMTVVFSDLKKRDMFFLDSYTTNKSVCKSMAQKTGIPIVRRDIFLDNDMTEEAINRQMGRLEELALAKGSVVAIGHDRELTIKVLGERIPELKKKGIRFVTLSEIVEDNS